MHKKYRQNSSSRSEDESSAYRERIKLTSSAIFVFVISTLNYEVFGDEMEVGAFIMLSWVSRISSGDGTKVLARIRGVHPVKGDGESSGLPPHQVYKGGWSVKRNN